MSNMLNPGLIPATMTGLQTVFDAGTAGEKSTFQAAVSGDADQAEFVRLLKVNGCTFNGVSDDAPGLQAAFAAFGTDRRVSLRIPVTGAKSAWLTANGFTGFGAVPCGVSISSNISVDFAGLTIIGHNLNNSGAYVLGINGAPIQIGGYSLRQFANNSTVYERAIIYSGNGLKGAMHVSGADYNRSAAYIQFAHMQFTGGSNSYGLVTYDNNCWALDFVHCGFYITNGADGFNGPVTATSSNAGATMRFRACNFDCSVGGAITGGYLCSNTSSGSFDYLVEGGSFEWQLHRKIMRYPAYYGPATVTLVGSYIEGYALATSPGPMVDIPTGNVNSSFRMLGGGITIFNSGSGTAPAYLFSPGDSAVSPAGINLTNLMFSNPGGATLNKTTALGRFNYAP